jgi:hypothetical protein
MGGIVMTPLEIGKELVALCRQNKNLEAIDKLYSPSIESIEAEPLPQMGKVQKGIDAIKAKNQRWLENSNIHYSEVNGPFPNGDQFIIHFTYDFTPKQSGKRMTMSEMGLYTVKDDKIVKEQFFYTMG